jgi:hypothetical protein
MSERRARLPAADGELWTLVEELVAGTATSTQRERLEARLRTEESARLFYVAYLDLHAALQWRMRGEASRPGAGRGPSRERRRVLLPFPGVWRYTVGAAVALAMGLLVAVLVNQHHGSDEAEAPDLPDRPAGSVAVLIDSGNPVWEADMTLPRESGAALPPGRVKLKAGVVEIAFHGGGEVLLEGPADFDVTAPDRGFLHRGKLTAKVADKSPAFQVAMPGFVVTERGGECGLLREESGLTEVHVFGGRVEAKPTGPQGESVEALCLLESTGARVDPARGSVTPVPFNERAFARLRPEVRATDAAVRGGQYAGCNFGTALQLMVKNSIPDYSWETYLHFDLSGVKGQVSEAKVRLFPVRVGTPTENAAALVADNQWGETAITWDTRPVAGPTIATWTAEEGKAVEIDVTRLVQDALAGDKMLSLRIFAPKRKRGKGYVQYGAREGEAEARPQLLLTTVP